MMNRLKPSQFNVTIRHFPQPGTHLLYNTLSRALVEIDDRGQRCITAFETAADTPPSVCRDEGAMGLIRTLQAQGFLVPSEWDEGERYLQALRSAAAQKGGTLDVTLLTNLQKCPLACVYCYQKGTHTGGRLAADPQEMAIEFIKRQCRKLSVERLFLSYYGSEPLSNPKAIFETANALGRFCRSHGIRFSFGMVTSGVLLTKATVEKLVPLGFCQAQITIDGDPQTHDATRPFQSGKGTYDVIMNSLLGYAGRIHTDVLCVVNPARVDAAYALIDTLADLGLAARKVRVKFSPESPDYAEETLKATVQRFADDGTTLMNADRDLLVEIAKLSIYAHARGLFADLLPQRTWCAMQRGDSRHLVIEPDGTLRTCPTLIGRSDQYKAGHISTGIGGIDTTMAQAYEKAPQCLSCKYLPICADCRVDALAKTGDLLGANSHEAEYDAIVPLLVKAHYRAIQRGILARIGDSTPERR